MPPRPKFTALDDSLYGYLVAHRTPDDAVVDELREETARLGGSAVMQIAPDQATLLRILVKVEAIRRFNEKVLADERVESVMLPVADGLMLARRRG